MRLAYSGGAFAGLADRLDDLANLGEQKMAENGAKAAQEALDREFAEERKPNGGKWKRKKRPNGKPTLEASGDMKDSAKAVPGPNGEILLTVDGPAEFHQHGTSKMAARQILPEGNLPKRWSGPIDEAAHKAIHGLMRR